MTPLAAAARDTRQAYRAFSHPARRLLGAEFLLWTGHGIAQVLFNLYLVQTGLGTRVAGHAVSLAGLGLALATLPANPLSRRWGRRRTIVLGLVIDGSGQVVRCASMLAPLVYGGSLLVGVGQAFTQIAAAPFLAEHSTPRERTHLFSAFFALSLIAGVAGSLIGGFLPRGILSLTPQLSLAGAYRIALAVGGIVSLSGAFVLAAARVHEAPEDPVARQHVPREVRRRLVPIGVNALLIGGGAGLVIPFMNLYFAQRFACSSGQIGSFFSIAQLGTALAALLAPAIARRFGKLRTAVASQLLSLPFLVTLGIERQLPLAVGAFWIRAVLMQASTPLLNTFVMEALPVTLRTTAMSFTNLAWNIGWSLSATLAGGMIVTFGYQVPFFTTGVLYAAAALYFFSAFRTMPESESPPRLSEEAKGHRADGP